MARALEREFPFEQLNAVAQLESWRKEIHRPIYHLHKWWANRLGSVFRAILLAGNSPEGADVWSQFYRSQEFRECIVLDPFMGSGTTVGEALKLGCRAVGADINPVAYFQVRKALEPCDERALRAAFRRLKERVAPEVTRFYRSRYQGAEADILYTFWVKVLPCPACGRETRLFRKWIFSASAYPGRNPEARAVCPRCGAINLVGYGDPSGTCQGCRHHYDLQAGPADSQQFRCEGCGARHRILEVVRRTDSPPEHRMYALLLLLPDGRKVYKQPDDADRALYEHAAVALRQGTLPIPEVEIPPGYNTNQARNHNYRFWHQMFNARQLYALGTLLREILSEPDRNARESLLLLFSGTLEFNNLFCSFKGEGTGAVRHLFHHHILKPERTPLEANPWGTKKSSGSFSTLFERRLLAAKRYCARPFELRVTHRNGKLAGEKAYGTSKPVRPRLAREFGELAAGQADLLLLAQDASQLPLPDESVDLIVTDPPYFDNVHYSELADFFYAWLRVGLAETEPAFRPESSRNAREVQGRDVGEFGDLLAGVFREGARVLKRQGLLAFTFHHSRSEAWVAVAEAVESAGFVVVAAHPVKAEMAVAVPKNQAKEPINLDLVVVCKRRPAGSESEPVEQLVSLIAEAWALVERYNRTGQTLSRGDIRVILMGAFLRAHSQGGGRSANGLIKALEAKIEDLYRGQRDVSDGPPEGRGAQLALSFRGEPLPV